MEWKHQVGQTNETRTRTNQLLNMTFSTTTVACLMNACSSGLCSVSFLNPDSSNPPRPIREKSPLKGAAGHRTCVASRPVSPNKARMEKRASVGAADTTATIFGILERLAAPFGAKSSDPLANLALQHS